ncbi:hypothetical protein Zmor_010774 [Zophobas morio]|uniref:Uncharacterized protein n=2 Tax=Zophobas morio TaxID=2755281 RepID=A0AA38IP76_9CUCU|nr:hypothetical protein Zmor_010774 [Zophobas morio]
MLCLRQLHLFKQAVKNFSTENVIKSRAKNLQIPKISLHEYMWQNLEKWSDRTAVACFETKRSYTYHQLYKKSLSLTRFLKESFKSSKEATVGIILPNIPEYPIVFLGAIQAGLRVTTCNPSYTSEEIKQQLKDSKSRIVFTTQELTSLVRQATDVPIVEISNNKSYTQGAISFDEISSGDTGQPIINVNVNDIILLPYSSGTTGLPKGVQLNHFNIVSNLSQIISPEFALTKRTTGSDQDVVPAFLPFFHIYGQVVVMLQALIQGAQLITMPKFSSDNFVKLVKNYKIDVLYGVPLVAIMAVNHPNIKKEDLTGIRFWMSGAAPLGGSDVERFREKTNDKVCIIQGYGMTETSPVTIIQTKKLEHGIKTGGSGLLVPNTEAKIVSLEEPSLNGLETNKSGELLIKGPQVMPGYFNNEEANKDIFPEEGWIRTGDIAYYDEHDQFYIIDRCKELIKVKGFQVAPAELEEILRGHPDVEDVGVVGIPHPVLGEAPKAFVVPKSGQTVKSSELVDYVSTKVSKHKQLTGGVVLVDGIPKSASGKILRRELKKM